MIEQKECVSCKELVTVINCHYQCENCGFSENCHDFPQMIDMVDIIDKNQ